MYIFQRQLFMLERGLHPCSITFQVIHPLYFTNFFVHLAISESRIINRCFISIDSAIFSCINLLFCPNDVYYMFSGLIFAPDSCMNLCVQPITTMIRAVEFSINSCLTDCCIFLANYIAIPLWCEGFTCDFTPLPSLFGQGDAPSVPCAGGNICICI